MHSIHSQLESLQFAAPVTHSGLTMQPLLDPTSSPADWLALDEALADGSARVTEVSERGSVPELFFENRGLRPVLLMDGEELVGAKQNRILNASILVAAQTRTRIPVSCVEQGRWSWRSRHFAASDRVLYPSARKAKVAQVAESLSVAGRFQADQGAIWADIAGKARRMDVRSETGAAAALYEQRAEELGDLVGAFHATDQQVGAAFYLDGELTGVDVVGCPRLFARLLPKLLRSYALDLLDFRRSSRLVRPKQPQTGGSSVDTASAARLLAHLGSMPGAFRASVGLGYDARFQDERVVGAALVLDDRIVQLSAFPIHATA